MSSLNRAAFISTLICTALMGTHISTAYISTLICAALIGTHIPTAFMSTHICAAIMSTCMYSVITHIQDALTNTYTLVMLENTYHRGNKYKQTSIQL